jgi:hypothetical protein
MQGRHQQRHALYARTKPGYNTAPNPGTMPRGLMLCHADERVVQHRKRFARNVEMGQSCHFGRSSPCPLLPQSDRTGDLAIRSLSATCGHAAIAPCSSASVETFADHKPKLRAGDRLPVIKCLHERYIARSRRPDARAAKPQARPAASCPSS